MLQFLKYLETRPPTSGSRRQRDEILSDDQSRPSAVVYSLCGIGQGLENLDWDQCRKLVEQGMGRSSDDNSVIGGK